MITNTRISVKLNVRQGQQGEDLLHTARHPVGSLTTDSRLALQCTPHEFSFCRAGLGFNHKVVGYPRGITNCSSPGGTVSGGYSGMQRTV